MKKSRNKKARFNTNLAATVNKMTDEFDYRTIKEAYDFVMVPTQQEISQFLGWCCRKGFIDKVGEDRSRATYILISEVVLE